MSKSQQQPHRQNQSPDTPPPNATYYRGTVVSDANDIVIGNNGNNRIRGKGGDDFLFGAGGDDTIYGESGMDEILGGNGDDRLYGGDGDDNLVGGRGRDHLDGGAGVDVAYYDDANDRVVVDLSSPGRNTGDAKGDSYANIEAIVGSLFNDELSGDSGENILAGGDGDDALEGRGGNDLLLGGRGNDVLDGGEGGDTLLGGSGNDELNGDTGDDELYGSLGNDELYGGAGNDVLFGGSGEDIIDGGAGKDSISFLSSLSGVVVYLNDNALNEGDASGDEYRSIEVVVGSSFADRLVGDENDNEIFGQGGDDDIIGGEGADLLDGGEGIDTVLYQTIDSAVTIDLSAVNEEGFVEVGADGGEGQGDLLKNVENIFGSSGADVLRGDSLANRFWGSNGNDELYGRGGNDRLDGGEGNDRLYGGEGDDLLSWSFGGDIFFGGEGIDTVTYETAEEGVETSLVFGYGRNSGAALGDSYVGVENLVGTRFADILIGDDFDNELYGGEGDDLLESGSGNGKDFYAGGAGIDTVSYVKSYTYAGGVIVDLQNPYKGINNRGTATGDTYESIEIIRGTEVADRLIGDDNDNVFGGNAGDDHLFGGVGADTLEGDAGDDFLEGGAGGDFLDGGAGQDLASYATASIGVHVDLSNSEDNSGDAAGDTFRSIENVLGSRFDDRLLGDAADNRLDGGEGNDFLAGGDGDDTLVGGAGNDFFIAGAGSDFFDGGEGRDRISYADAQQRVVVDLRDSLSNSGDAQGDTLISIEVIEGSRFADILTGDDAHNTFTGGAGADIIRGGEGSDSVWYLNSDAGVRVFLRSGGSVSGGHADGDMLYDIENILGSRFADRLAGDHDDNSLSGYRGDDVLYGNGGDDLLYGDEGDDVLHGGAGADTLDGGRGADRYVFRARDGHDRIFERSGDENEVVFRSLPGLVYSEELFDFSRQGDDLYIATALGNEVVLTDYYGSQELSYQIYTENTQGVLAELSVDL